MNDLAVLLLRVVTGGLIAGHGSQKLLGAFEGPGLAGTAGMMESMGLRPGTYWGTAAALSESAGGLTALGFLHPLGPIGTIAAMTMATLKVHRGKPIWVTAGGAELPVINITAALALILMGPGKYSLDNLLGIRLPKPLVIVVALSAAAGVVYGAMSQPQSQPQPEHARERVDQAA